MPLIQRTGDGMLLTDAGREVLALADRIEAAIADCATTLEMMAGKTAGRISIGAVSTAKYFVPFMISGFSKLHPNIDVTLSIGNRQEIGTALRGYDLDFAIMGRPPADIDMDVHLIGDHPHVIIAPTAHRLARKSRIAPSELASETFLTREPGSGTRGLMEQLFETAGIRPKIGMAMSSNETIKQAVIAGLGIAFISAQRLQPNSMNEGWSRSTSMAFRLSGNGSCSPARTRCCCRPRRRCGISSAFGESSFSRACTAGCASPGRRSAASAVDASCGARIRVGPRSPSPLRYRYVEHSGEAIFRYGMGRTRIRDLAARRARALPERSAPENERAQGTPGALGTRGPCAKKMHTVVTTGTPGSAGVPCAMVLRLMPRSPWRRIRFVTIAGELNGDQARLSRSRLRRLDTSNGCQDHTVLPYASHRHPDLRRTMCCPQEMLEDERRSSARHCRSRKRSALRQTLRARRCRVHRILSRVRDDRDTPLLPGKGRGKLVELICPTPKAKYFL